MRVAVEFIAGGSFGPLIGEINRANAALAGMNKQVGGMAQGNRIVDTLRRSIKDQINTLGGFQTQSMRVQSSTNAMTEAIRKQEVTLRGAMRAWKESGNIVQQQMRLRQSALAIWKKDAMGNMWTDLIVPQGVISGVNTASARFGVFNAILSSVSHNMVNLGKNMQWAGRQLLVGISLPLAAFGAGAAMAARQVDKEMTRLIKVYGDVGGASESELARVKVATRETASAVARNYGIMSDQTVGLAADLAAAGYQGMELQRTVEETSRIMMLGEIDRQTAMKGTIAIQSVWNKNSTQLAETMNTFNAIENATTISTEELFTGMPRLAGVVNQLGGSAEYAAAMLAGMKEGGVDVLRGATAIRTSLARIVDPVPEATEKFAQFGVNIKEVVASQEGNLQGLMKEYARLFNEVIPEGNAQVDLAQALFGTQRFSEMLVLLHSMGEETGAFAKSMEILGEDTATMAEVARVELERYQQSASGRFKRLTAELKDQFALMGEPLMEVINRMIEPIVRLFEAFNGLPGVVKQFAIFGGMLMLLVGPIVMLSGLFMNFVGQIGTAIAFVLGLGKRFKLLTADEQAAALAAKQGTNATQTQTEAYQRLTSVLAGVNVQLETLARNQANAARTAAQAAVANRTGIGMPVNPNETAAERTARQRREWGQRWGNETAAHRENDARNRAARATQVERDYDARMAQQEANAASQARRMQRVNREIPIAIAGMTTSIGLLGTMISDTGTWINRVSTGLLMFGLFVPLLTQIGVLQKVIIGLQSVWNGMIFLGSVMMPKVALATRMMAAGMMAALGPITAIVAAAGALYYLLQRNEKAMKKQNVTMQEGAKILADNVGATWHEVGSQVDETGKVVDGLQTRIARLRTESPEMVNSLKRAAAQGKEALRGEIASMAIGMELHGATPQQVHDAVQAALNAAGATKLGVELDWEGAVNDADAHAAAYGKKIADIIAGKNNTTWKDKFNTWPGFLEPDAQSQGNVGSTEFTTEDRDNARAIGIQLGEAVRAGIEQGSAAFEGIDKALAAAAAKYGENSDNFRRTQKQIVQGFLALAGDIELPAEDTIDTVEELKESLLMNDPTYGAGLKVYQEHVDRAKEKGVPFTSELKEQALKAAYAASGMSDFSGEVGKYTDETDDATEATQALSDAQREMVDSLRQGVEDELQNATQIGMELFDQATQAELDAIGKRGDAQEQAKDDELQRIQDTNEDRKAALDEEFRIRADKLEAQQKHAMDVLEQRRDDEIDAVKAVQEAEEERDRARQRLFEAEERRQKRLAEDANRAIDLNSALAGGDLDEAARIIAEGQADMVSRNNEDGQGAAELAKAARDKAAEQRIEDIKDKYAPKIENLKAYQREQKNALDEEKRDRQKALDDALEGERRRIAAEKDTIRQRIEGEKRAYQNRRNLDKLALENAIKAGQTLAATNRDAFKASLDQTKGILGQFGVAIGENNKAWNDIVKNGWTRTFDNIRAEVAVDAEWKKFGSDIANDVADGLLQGMTWQEFLNYLETGDKPKPKPGQTGGNQFNWGDIAMGGGVTPTKQYAGNKPVPHGGGLTENVSRNSSRQTLKPDEVPAILQTGEFVINRDTVSKFGADYFEALQAAPRFHTGGQVGHDSINAGISGNLGFLMGAILRTSIEKSMMAATQRRDEENRASGRPLMLVPAPGSLPIDPTAAGAAQGPVIPGLDRLMAPDRDATWRRAGGWTEGLRPNVVSAVAGTLAKIPGGQTITSAFRTRAEQLAVNPGVPNSDHTRGKAVDIAASSRRNGGSAAQEAMGDLIANTFRSLPEVRTVLWKTMTGGNHHNHVHVSFYHGGGLVGGGMSIPSLAVGGNIRYDNTLANLHAGEKVLTAPLAAAYDRQVQNLDNSTGNVYHIKVEATPDTDGIKVGRDIVKALKQHDRKSGGSNKR